MDSHRRGHLAGTSVGNACSTRSCALRHTQPETVRDHGDVVRDREDDPDPAIVVDTPGAPADGWDIPRFGKTVAEDDPDYPSDAEIVAVVYELSFAR